MHPGRLKQHDQLTAAIAVLRPAGRERSVLGLPRGPLRLRRAWPRRSGRLLLEYWAADGRIIGGQWLADPRQLGEVAEETRRSGPAELVEAADGHRVLLQSAGADRRLPGLAPLLAQPGSTLLVHRPEQRAVVRLPGSPAPAYARVVPPSRLEPLVGAVDRARGMADGAFTTPVLREVDRGSGVGVFESLPGAPLHELLGSDEALSQAPAIGRALRTLHAADVRPETEPHGPDAEARVLRMWVGRLPRYAASLARPTSEAAAVVADALRPGRPVRLVPAHRDLHDKQIFLDGGPRASLAMPASRIAGFARDPSELTGRAEGVVTHAPSVGLLDFDTLAAAEPALDLANLLVHLELRALQGDCDVGWARRMAEDLLEGYGTTWPEEDRLSAYADATRVRLACVYAFRPRWSGVSEALLSRVGANVPGTGG
jgi:Phosphotransferase enzyme family